MKKMKQCHDLVRFCFHLEKRIVNHIIKQLEKENLIILPSSASSEMILQHVLNEIVNKNRQYELVHLTQLSCDQSIVQGCLQSLATLLYGKPFLNVPLENGFDMKIYQVFNLCGPPEVLSFQKFCPCCMCL